MTRIFDQDEAFAREVMAALDEEENLLDESHLRVEARATGLGADEVELLREEGLSLVEPYEDWNTLDLDVRRNARRPAA